MDLPAEAQAYAQADFSAVNQAFVDRLVELGGTGRGVRALDLGTGPADIPIRLLRATRGWHVTAVDASAPMLAIARSAVIKAGLTLSIRLLQADAKKTPLVDQSFDLIFSNSILHHLDDTVAFWREVRRLGRPEAIVLVRDLARPETPDAAQKIIRQYAGKESKLLQDEFYRSLLAAYTPEEIKAQLASGGLDYLEVAMVTDRHVDIFGRLR